jgi:hypothetical protein
MHATIASPPASDLDDDGYSSYDSQEEYEKSASAQVAVAAEDFYAQLNANVTPPSKRWRSRAPHREDPCTLAMAWFTTLYMLVGANLSLFTAKAALLLNVIYVWTPEELAADEMRARRQQAVEAAEEGKRAQRHRKAAAARVAARRAEEGAPAGARVDDEDEGDGGEGEGGRAAGSGEGVTIKTTHNPVPARGDLPLTEPTSVGTGGGTAAEGSGLHRSAQSSRPLTATAPVPTTSEAASVPAGAPPTMHGGEAESGGAAATASGGSTAAAGRAAAGVEAACGVGGRPRAQREEHWSRGRCITVEAAGSEACGDGGYEFAGDGSVGVGDSLAGSLRRL